MTKDTLLKTASTEASLQVWDRFWDHKSRALKNYYECDYSKRIDDSWRDYCSRLGIKPEFDLNGMVAASEYKYLPNDVATKVYSLARRLEADVASATKHTPPDPSDLGKVVELQKEWVEELKVVLTPNQFDSFSLHDSPLARQLRYEFSDFQPSEKEYLTLVNVLTEGSSASHGLAISLQA